ncbi:sensor histidine kinase [Candidatus Poribacteria bacterium]|nr:sensor histidine kinase [Candidatus Poribacteria bacterium]
MSKIATRLSKMEDDFRHILKGSQILRTSFSFEELTNELRKEASTIYPNLQFETAAVGPTWRPFADRNDTYQAVWELIVNAAHWTDGAGIVTISARKAEAEEIPGDTMQGMSFIQLDIRDNGPGIPRENRERIFKGYSTRQEGTGQGLMFARERVERNDGSLYAAHPDEEAGAHFVLLLPNAM